MAAVEVRVVVLVEGAQAAVSVVRVWAGWEEWVAARAEAQEAAVLLVADALVVAEGVAVAELRLVVLPFLMPTPQRPHPLARPRSPVLRSP